jgi:hypothetical protein
MVPAVPGVSTTCLTPGLPLLSPENDVLSKIATGALLPGQPGKRSGNSNCAQFPEPSHSASSGQGRQYPCGCERYLAEADARGIKDGIADG